jgi:hypothetical protein
MFISSLGAMGHKALIISDNVQTIVWIEPKHRCCPTF